MLELSNMVFEVTIINMLKEIVKQMDNVDGCMRNFIRVKIKKFKLKC